MTAPTPKLMTLAELDARKIVRPLCQWAPPRTRDMECDCDGCRAEATIRAQHEALKAADEYSQHDAGCLATYNTDQPPPNSPYPCKCGYERESAAWRSVIAAVEGKP